MPSSVFPIAPRLSALLGSMLVTTLPGGPYVLPATLQPMLLLILSGEIRLHRPLADGLDPLILPPLGLCGATRGMRYAEATPGTRILIVSVLPGQLPRLFGLPAVEVIDVFVPLADLLPGRALAELSENLAAAPSTAAQVACFTAFLLTLQAAQEKRGADLILPDSWLFRPLAEIAAAFDLGPRQFERRFNHSYGQSLRSFRQQARCSRMLADRVFGRRQIADWADIAAAAGYCDQAHLSRDLRRFTGYSPALLGRRLAADDPALWPYRLSAAQLARLFGSAVF